MAERLYRKVIRIRGADSPNVRYALARMAKGLPPTDIDPETGKMIIEGVLPWDEYKKRRATWDKIRQCIGLDAQFYMGSELLLYPIEWLNWSEELARRGPIYYPGLPCYMGCDPAEGGDKSSWAIVNENGLIKLMSVLTPNTTVIPDITEMLMAEYSIPPQSVCFDAGGGGNIHINTLAFERGKKGIRPIAFGGNISLEPKRGLRQIAERKEIKVDQQIFGTRRTQLYGELSELLDPSYGGFAIPAGIRGILDDPSTDLRHQMAPIPKRYREGKLMIPPKNRKTKDSTEETLTDLIGHSPDELDAVTLAVHAMLHKGARTAAGVA